ncbi:MAG: hypothetical protein COU08_03505 [Candidatus Harrisonbacteria bacterium CG10_big_fil_rev_8_21_14_0_10_42_17]|uniref:DUF2157 domain-containing protein n=1 Tax=Candidatus Harrisonbacteria bacterium CG10_big_fil_rev_8_21_14_0_10_42_17 TaxID=1974584 RepID=A0A2M6WHE7_9BACT|nr:MAG: hypothetical protein COU08_03505 [Candidatus Harrisonbacteria bacterium CG10_big_fil_rev_8_21_14_0_10_42_17]
MNKEELLHSVRSLAGEHRLSKQELLDAYYAGSGEKRGTKHGFQLAKILYYLGGIIVFLGLVILIVQNWRDFNDVTRIVVTLGPAIAAYIVGVLFSRDEQFSFLGKVFHVMGALLMPVGVGVSFDVGGYNLGSSGVASVILLLLSLVYLASLFTFRKTLFLIFATFFTSALYFSTTSFLLGSYTGFSSTHFFQYRVLVLGFSYLLFGYGLLSGAYKAFTPWLYGVGALAFLGAALALGGFRPSQNVFWELAFPFLVFGFILLSIYLRSKVFLWFGSFYLMGYILKITSEYFTDSLGWPLALVLVGFVLMGVGYCTFYVSRKYISPSAA